MEGKELTVLPAIFQQLAAFNYNKAKDIAEKERSAVCSSGLAIPLWPSFLACLAQLATVEKLYMNLNILNIKGFLRKENSLRASYEGLLTDLSELEIGATNVPTTQSIFNEASQEAGPSPRSSGGGLRELVSSLSAELRSFITARLCLIKFYEKCYNHSCSGDSSCLDYGDLAASIVDIANTCPDGCSQPLLSALHDHLKHECDVLQSVLQGLCSIQHHSFLSALLHLDAAHESLTSWQKLILCRESKKYSLGSVLLKGSSVPALFQWLWQVRATATAKFSLYFFNSLASQTTLNDMKTLLAKQPTDYVAKLVSFHRRVDATGVCLVLESSGLPDYQGPGYHLQRYRPPGVRRPSPPSSPPSARLPPPPPTSYHTAPQAGQTIRSFERIFICPVSPPLSCDVEAELWASLLCILGKHPEQLPPLKDDVCQVYHHQSGYTHYLRAIEPLVTAAVSYDCHRVEKDSVPVRAFLNDLYLQLNLTTLFASLKPR
ncbi:KICSTOR complex protein C12orf66-like [Trinorchestia longiramus]|nr:KICSTOR complex protein C12orf66-like [Trinorchestia longiramus]